MEVSILRPPCWRVRRSTNSPRNQINSPPRIIVCDPHDYISLSVSNMAGSEEVDIFRAFHFTSFARRHAVMFLPREDLALQSHHYLSGCHATLTQLIKASPHISAVQYIMVHFIYHFVH